MSAKRKTEEEHIKKKGEKKRSDKRKSHKEEIKREIDKPINFP